MTTTTADPTRGFTSDMLAGLEEPVRRYFSHAIDDGAALPNGVHMTCSLRALLDAAQHSLAHDEANELDGLHE